MRRRSRGVSDLLGLLHGLSLGQEGSISIEEVDVWLSAADGTKLGGSLLQLALNLSGMVCAGVLALMLRQSIWLRVCDA